MAVKEPPTANPHIAVKLALINILFIGMLVLVHLEGGINAVLEQNMLGLVICANIVFLHICGLRLNLKRSRELDREFDLLENDESGLLSDYKEHFSVDPGTAKSLLEEGLEWRLNRIDYISELLPYIGIFGTFVGVLVAFQVVENDDGQFSGNSREVMKHVFSFMGVAFYTSIVGYVCARWNRHNHFELQEVNTELSRRIIYSALKDFAAEKQRSTT